MLEPVTVAVVPAVLEPSNQLYYEHLDRSVTLRPHTTYEYRVAAQTSSHLTRSPWSRILTMSASQFFAEFYVRQVNGVKLADILFYLRFRPSVCAHSYVDANISKTV